VRYLIDKGRFVVGTLYPFNGWIGLDWIGLDGLDGLDGLGIWT